MKHWHLKRIDELGTVVTGKTPSSNNPDEFGSIYPFITPSDIPNTQKYITVERYLSEKGMASHRRIKLPPKATCVVCIGATIGKTCMTQNLSFSNQQINSIIANQHNDTDFIYYLATTLRDSLVAFAGGSATPILNKSAFSSIKVLVPEKRIQCKIAAVLSAYDDLIENNNHRIAILEKMAEELYREWFVRLRFPGHEKAKFHKGIPDGWEIAKLAEAINMKMGQSPPSEFYNSSGDGLPFNQGVGTYGYRFPRKVMFCSCNGRVANQGDILFSVRAPVGRLNIADCRMIIGRGLAALSHKKGYNAYLFYLLKTLFANEDIIGNGAIFNSVGKDELSSFKYLQPNSSLDKNFNDNVRPIDQGIEFLIKTIENLTISRNLLLTRLMSGKLDVENLDIRFPKSMEESIA